MKHLFFFILPFFVFAQKPHFGERTKFFVGNQTVESMLEESAEKAFLDYGFNKKLYGFHKNDLNKRLLPLTYKEVARKLNLVERGLSDTHYFNDSRREKTLKYIKTEVYRGVRDVLHANIELFKNILENARYDGIIKYHSEIYIERDGKIRVTETILINNGSDGPIKRGIYRELPTKYETKNGFVLFTPLSFEKVLKNGKPEPYYVEALKNGKRIYVGLKEIQIEEGLHEYELTYVMERILSFTPEETVFYWNVNGNGWDFSIPEISCTVNMPEGSAIKAVDCYTGQMGSTEKFCSFKQKENQVTFKNTKPLEPQEGLTISISNGIISPPSVWVEALYFIRDNFPITVIFIFVLCMFLSNLVRWFKFGRDPKAKTIVPQFYPPQEISPVDAAVLYHRKFEKRFITIALFDLAAQKLISITQGGNTGVFKSTKNYYLKSTIQPENQHINSMRKRWYGFDSSLLNNMHIKSGDYNSRLETIVNQFEVKVKDRVFVKKEKNGRGHGMFAMNDGFLPFHIFMLVALSVFCLIALVIVFTVTLLLVCLSLIFFGIIQEIVFFKLLKAYTKRGREVMDYLLGFRMYLSNAEVDQYNADGQPEKTINIYEQYMPYAMAMDCDIEWAKKFETVIKSMKQEGYSSEFTRDTDFNSNRRSSFSSSGSFYSGLSSTVVSSSSPPSESGSSSSSGGGSSGGGGGGGGGGGW